MNMKKRLFQKTTLLVAFLGTTLLSWSQTPFTAFANEIGVTECPASNVNFNAGAYTDLPSGLSFSGFTRNVVGCTAAASHYRSSNFTSTSKANAISEERYVTWSFTANDEVEFTLSEIALRHERSGQGGDNGAIYYSVNGSPFEQVGGDFVIVDANTRDVFTFDAPVSIPAEGTIEFRWYCWRTVTTGTGNTRFKGGVDYATGSGITGTYSSTLPSLAVNPAVLNNFNQVLGNPSAEQAFVVSGINLTDDVTVNAPLGYEISLSSGSDFLNTLILSPTAGVLSNTTVYVRLNASEEGDFNGDIEVSTTGVTTITIALTGVVGLVEPPVINVVPNALSNFLQFFGTPSQEQELFISGFNLIDDITLVSPVGFEVSQTSGSGFTSSILLTQTAGELEETVIYVRLNHNVIGSIFDNIVLSSDGIDAIEVPVSGSVEAPVPPTLGVAPTELNAFLQNLGFPSASQTVTVGGSELNGNIEISVSGSFFISTDISGPFTQAISMTPEAQYVDPSPIYVHLNAASVGEYTGTMTISTPDLDAVEIELTGSAVQPQGSLIYYWHFNTLETPEDVTMIEADYSLVPGVVGHFEYTNPEEGQRDMDVYDFGSLLNAQMGEGAGKGVRVRNPSTDRTLDFFVPTNFANGIKFSYAIQRSNSGMLENIFSYSIDGTNFISTGLDENVIEISTAYQIHTIDFSNIPEVNDNPNFRIRISFEGNTVSPSGNNRIDNITLIADTYLSISNDDFVQVVVFPNPADESIHILANAEINKLTVFDLNGRIVLQAKESSFDISHLESGMYYMLIETGAGTIQRSFVKK